MAPNLEKLQTCNQLLKDITFSNFKSVFEGVCIKYFKAKRDTNMEIEETPKKEIQILQWVDNASHVGSVTAQKEFCT